MGGFEEQFYPNACADEIEEFSAILSVRDVVNNSIATESGYYFVLKLRGWKTIVTTLVQKSF